MIPNMRSRVPARQVADITRELEERRVEGLSSARRINHSTVTRPGGVRVVGEGSIESEAPDGSATRLAYGQVEQRPSPDADWEPVKAEVDLSDGTPPTAAPSIAAFPGSDYVAARLSWVDNPDELHSRVYASTTPEPDLAGPEVGTVANGGVLVVREFGDGTDLAQDVDLWLQAVPFDVDGDGPASGVVGPVRLAKVTRTQIGEHEIETRHLAADAITADLLVTNRALAEALEVEDLDGVNIRGVNVEAGKFTGGAIVIAQGVASARSTGFDSTSGKTPPSGWSLARSGYVEDADTVGVFFDTTGGVTGGSMRTVAREWTADDFNLYTWESLYLTTAEATDTRITFDYRTTRSGRPWRTYDMRPQDAWGQTRIVFRLGATMAGQTIPQTLIVDLTNCAPIAYSGSEMVGNYYPPFSGPADRWPAANTWHSCELIYRGAVLSVRQGPRGGQMGPWQHYTVPLNIRPGHVVLEQLHGDVPDSGQIHGSGRTGTAAIVNAGTMRFDNLAVETLAGGLAVEPTGATHVPLVPAVNTHAASKRYADELRYYVSASGGDTGAFTGTTQRETASLNFVSAGTSAVYTVLVDIDAQVSTNGGDNRVGIKVDGTATGPLITTSVSGTGRLGGSRTFTLTGLSAGSHTVSGYTFSQSGTTRVYRTDLLLRRIA